ncbi:MAG: DUF5050 domain-containing protein [Verrucomicrobiota bacterium]
MKNVTICVFAVCLLTSVASHAATTNAILFVTQVPMPTEINAREVTSSVCNVTSPFSNHLGDTAHAAPGGGLWIRYANGALTNLTALAGFTNVAVREPSVDWSGTKAIFSMTTGTVWQMYEITNWIAPVITPVSNQPTNYNNVSPTYGSNGRIIFASDRPRDGSAYLYPQREEYLQLPTVTGLWSLDPSSGNLFLMEHSPSGSFRPLVDSAGRVLFTRWDHLSRDVEAVSDRQGKSTNNVFNWSSELPGSVMTTNTLEVFPEPRPSDTNALAGTNLRGNAFNIFLPWQINEDGTSQEIINHIGRHELMYAVDYATFTNNPDIVTGPVAHFNTNTVNNFFLAHEDLNVTGLVYGVDAIDIGTHTAGQIVSLTAGVNTNPDFMVINYLTPRSTVFPNAFGVYRNPRMLSNGVLIASFTPAATGDTNLGTATVPVPLYNFRLMTLKNTGGTWTTNNYLTTGPSKTYTYWVGANQVTYTGPLWELDPAEIAPRPVPTSATSSVDPIEAAVFAEEGVSVPTFQSWLVTNQYALVVSRDVTMRDHADKQQPYNLKVAWSGTQTVATAGTKYTVGYLQMFQADQLRSVKPDGVNPLPGRRVIAQPWHDSIDDNPAPLGNIPGTAQLGPDGSFAVVVPTRRAMTWQTVDTNGTPIVRERYWVTFQPGEIRTCANCHGINTGNQINQPKPTNKPEALRTLLRWWKVVNLPVTAGRIIFNTQRDGDYEVYAMNPDGSALVNLTHTNSFDVIPRVSYDGKTIVFMSDRDQPGYMDIWKMNSDGSGLVNLTQTNLYGSSLWAAAPNFDASKIVYMGPRTNTGGGYNLYVMNGDGSGQTNLTANTGDGDFPYWSYDGSKIVFDSLRDNNNKEEIYIMNANGSGQTRLTFTPGRDFYPVISPDGTKIAFTSELTTNRQIHIMNIDGTGRTNISGNAYNEQTAYFSPDGTKLSFTSGRDGNPEVYVMNIDGSNQTRLTFTAGQEAYPAWGNIAATPYNLWQQANLGTIVDDTGDPDSDGQATLLEYVLGSNPSIPNVPNYTATPSGLAFTRSLGATDVTVKVEARSDLVSGSWTNLATKVGAGNWSTVPGVTVNDPGTGAVSVNESTNLPARFYRLHVSHP